jgi:SAM-dependent methyltransferase
MTRGMIVGVADNSVSRRSLLSLRFAVRPPPPDYAPLKEAIADRWSAGADGLLRAWEPLAPALCDAADVEEGLRVLDVGTGDGNVALEAARRGAAVTACDLGHPQIARARAREMMQDPAGREGARPAPVFWTAADVERLPFDDVCFDVVLSAHGAILAPRPRRALREMLRTLRPGGLLALAAPAPDSLLARALELSGESFAAAWGREDVMRERILAVAPGTEVEVRTHTLELAFESERDAWLAHAGPLGLTDAVRDAFADAVAVRSHAADSVRIDEPVTLVLARRAA